MKKSEFRLSGIVLVVTGIVLILSCTTITYFNENPMITFLGICSVIIGLVTIVWTFLPRRVEQDESASQYVDPEPESRWGPREQKTVLFATFCAILLSPLLQDILGLATNARMEPWLSLGFYGAVSVLIFMILFLLGYYSIFKSG